MGRTADAAGNPAALPDPLEEHLAVLRDLSDFVLIGLCSPIEPAASSGSGHVMPAQSLLPVCNLAAAISDFPMMQTGLFLKMQSEPTWRPASDFPEALRSVGERR
jgi:hypothetical protein